MASSSPLKRSREERDNDNTDASRLSRPLSASPLSAPEALPIASLSTVPVTNEGTISTQEKNRAEDLAERPQKKRKSLEAHEREIPILFVESKETKEAALGTFIDEKQHTYFITFKDLCKVTIIYDRRGEKR